MKIEMETERLYLRNVRPDDYQSVFKWAGDPVVNEYMIYPVYTDPENVRTWIETQDASAPDQCEIVLILKETGEIIGGGGIRLNDKEGTWEFGYNLCRAYWGNGYVPEAMRALIDYVRTIRDVKVITATYAVENNKSRRVMEKLGLTPYKETEYTKLDGSRTFAAVEMRRYF